MSDVVLAIDAGGTKLLGGLVTGDGAVLDADEVATPRAPEGCDPGLRALAALAARLADMASAAGHRAGVGKAAKASTWLGRGLTHSQPWRD